MDEFGTIITPNEKEEILNKMKELIDTSPDKAMQYLRTNSAASMLLSKFKSRVKDPENENYKTFLKLLEEEKDNILLPISSLDKNGMALTLELLIDHWRETYGDNDILAMSKLYEKSIQMIEDKIDITDASKDNRIVMEMLTDFKVRIKSLENYERKQFRKQFEEHEEKVKEYVRELVNATIGLKDMSKELLFVLRLATMSSSALIEFKANLSKIISKELRNAFGFEEEEMKYNLAPWIGILEHTAERLNDDLKTSVENLEVAKEDYKNPDKNYL